MSSHLSKVIGMCQLMLGGGSAVTSERIAEVVDQICSMPTFGGVDRAELQRVLEELLNDRGGTLHHFAGGDLVGDRRVEYADYRHTYFVLAGTTAAQVSSIVWPQCSAQTFSTSPPDTPARCSFLTSPGWRFSACRIRSSAGRSRYGPLWPKPETDQ